MKHSTHCVFRNSTAAKRAAQQYRKQFGIGLDGKPRRYGRKPKDKGVPPSNLNMYGKYHPG